ncbi:MAG: hypothetical protein ACI91R_002446 [Vicingaceae bacterium]|jgi:hypothetical protein
MKKKFCLAAFAVATLFSMHSNAQMAFSISTGLGLNSAFVGYKVNAKLMPFFAFQSVGGSYKYSYNGFDYNPDTKQIEETNYEDKGRFRIYAPSLGLKYFLNDADSKVNTYVLASVSKPFATAKAEFDGDEDEFVSDEVSKTSLWGYEGGFGAEYKFDDHFSIGGEFGVRAFTGSYSDSYEEEVYNDETNDFEMKTFEFKYKGNFNFTYSKISLNFYF